MLPMMQSPHGDCSPTPNTDFRYCSGFKELLFAQASSNLSPGLSSANTRGLGIVRLAVVNTTSPHPSKRNRGIADLLVPVVVRLGQNPRSGAPGGARHIYPPSGHGWS